MTPATRYALAGTAWVLVLTGLAIAGIGWHSRALAERQWAGRLRTAAAVGTQLQATRLQELRLRAAPLAGDQAFVDYVAQSLIPDPRLGNTVDSASISDLLNERRQGYDLAMVLDPQGQPVASSGILTRERAAIRRDPLVARTIATQKSVHGFWLDHGRLLQVATEPLLRGGALQGVLLTGAWVGQDLAATVGRLDRATLAIVGGAGSDIAVTPASAVDDGLRANSARILAIRSAGGQLLHWHTDAGPVDAWVVPLAVGDGRAALVALTPSDAVAADAHAFGAPLQWGAALLGLIALGLLSLPWWRTYRPLQDMASVIARAAEGDVNLTVRGKGSASVRQLREPLNRLLLRAR